MMHRLSKSHAAGRAHLSCEQRVINRSEDGNSSEWESHRSTHGRVFLLEKPLSDCLSDIATAEQRLSDAP